MQDVPGMVEIYKMADAYESENPDIAAAMTLLGISLDRYEASLSAMYRPRIVTQSSTQELSAREAK